MKRQHRTLLMPDAPRPDQCCQAPVKLWLTRDAWLGHFWCQRERGHPGEHRIILASLDGNTVDMRWWPTTTTESESLTVEKAGAP